MTARILPPGTVLACGLLLLAWPASAQAPDPDARIAEIREMVLYARYQDSIEAATELLATEGLSARQRNAALEVLATAQLANRQQGDAEATLSQLYARDPQHRLGDPDASPLVQSAFARARDSATEPVHVELLHDSPGTLPSRDSPLITVALGEGADAVDEVRLAYRYEGERRYATLVMTLEGEQASARIPLQAGADEQYGVQYWIEATAPSRAPLARLGSADEPLGLTVQASTTPVGEPLGPVESGESDGGILGQWWFWTAVAVVLAGGAAAYVVLGPPSEGPPDGSLGNVTLGLW